MSSILKALRKVEDDKAALGEGSVDLAHDILKQNYRLETTFSWPVVAVAALVLLALLIGAWLWLAAGQRGDTSGLADRADLPSSSSRDEKVPLASVSTLPVEVDKAVEPRQNLAAVAGGPVVEIPLLQIEEIICLQDSASRLAVINGLPVMEGTDIEGARIEKIFTDRVQFLFQGVRFNKYKSNLK